MKSTLSIRIATLVLLLILLTACSQPLDVSGRWEGSLTGAGTTSDIAFTLQQSGNSVSGTFTNLSDDLGVAVDGSISGQVLELGASDEVSTASFTGTVTGDEIGGTWQASMNDGSNSMAGTFEVSR